LAIAGIVLLGYGIYTLTVPETVVSIGALEVKAKDNNSAYITIGLGLIALLFGVIGGRKS
jgi:hypothetical protein